MNDVVAQLIDIAATPGNWLNDLLGVSGVSIYGHIASLLLFVSFSALSLMLLILWRERTFGVYFAAALVTLLAGAVLSYGTATYAAAWVYAIVLILVVADILWRGATRKPFKPVLGWWVLASVIVTGSVAGGIAVAARLHGQETSGKLLTTVSSGKNAVQDQRHSVAAIMGTLAADPEAIALAKQPKPSSPDIAAIQIRTQLDFLELRDPAGKTLARTTRAPRDLEINGAEGLVTRDERGVPVIAAKSQLDGSTLVGGMFLDNARLKELGITGAIISPFGVESSANLAAAELSAVTSSDARTAANANPNLSIFSDASGSRTYVKSLAFDGRNDLAFVSAATDTRFQVWERGVYVIGAVLTLAISLALAWLGIRLGKGKFEVVFAAVLLALSGAYAIWLGTALRPGSSFVRNEIRLDRPAATPHVYFRATDTGLSIQLDMAGANVAAISLSVQLPMKIAASSVKVDPAFCTTVKVAPTISSDNVLNFSCGTPNPPFNGQGGTIASIAAPRETFLSGSTSLVNGSAEARTETAKNEVVPVRADPLIP